jgi:hypothetical protein
MPIALSHGGSTVYSSPSLSKQVLVGTKEDIAIIERERSGDDLCFYRSWRAVEKCGRRKPDCGLTPRGDESGKIFPGTLTYSFSPSGFSAARLFWLA